MSGQSARQQSEPILSVRNLVKDFPIRAGIVLDRTIGHDVLYRRQIPNLAR